MHILQAIEQLQATLRDVSPMLWSYKCDLKKEGFTDKEAFELVRDYQKIMFTQPTQK